MPLKFNKLMIVKCMDFNKLMWNIANPTWIRRYYIYTVKMTKNCSARE